MMYILVYYMMILFYVFLFYCSVAHRDLHSFPTRRSSDLEQRLRVAQQRPGDGDPLLLAAGERGGIAIEELRLQPDLGQDRKSTRLNSSHGYISYAVFCLKKKKRIKTDRTLAKRRHKELTD